MHIYISAYKMKRICSVAREESIVNGSETLKKKSCQNPATLNWHHCIVVSVCVPLCDLATAGPRTPPFSKR